MHCLGSLFINKFRIDKNCHHLSLFTFTEVYLLIRYIHTISQQFSRVIQTPVNVYVQVLTTIFFISSLKKSENWAHKSVKWNALNLLSGVGTYYMPRGLLLLLFKKYTIESRPPIEPIAFFIWARAVLWNERGNTLSLHLILRLLIPLLCRTEMNRCRRNFTISSSFLGPEHLLTKTYIKNRYYIF